MDPEKNTRVRVQQYDENGQICFLYEESNLKQIKPSSSPSLFSLWTLVSIFLPTGYPRSVRPDYVHYQIYDSLQAFASSIVSLFANRCVLSAMGVGDDSATSSSALFMKLTQEIIGRLGTIGFAWKLGSTLEPECKKYRFAADLVNDSAFVFDCLTSSLPGIGTRLKICLLCLSGLLRAICGVMASSSRAALTQHFTDPVHGSIADVSAKDASQETVISLMGMLAGSAVVGLVPGDGARMWMCVLPLIAVHLYTNYQAVSGVILHSLNRQRTNIVFSQALALLLVEADQMGAKAASDWSLPATLRPKEVSKRERLLESENSLCWFAPFPLTRSASLLPLSSRRKYLGRASFCTFDGIRQLILSSHSQTVTLDDLVDITARNGYLLYFSVPPATTKPDVRICVLDDAPENADLRAWAHALFVAYVFATSSLASDPLSRLETIKAARAYVEMMFDANNMELKLSELGWLTSRTAIQTDPYQKIHLIH